MDRFADCTKRGARSATKLYNLQICPGNEGAEMHFRYLKFYLFSSVKNGLEAVHCQ